MTTSSEKIKSFAKKKCPIEAGEMRCVRDEKHGDIHVSPEGYFWLLDYQTREEELGIIPMTGYRIISDRLIDVLIHIVEEYGKK